MHSLNPRVVPLGWDGLVGFVMGWRIKRAGGFWR